MEWVETHHEGIKHLIQDITNKERSIWNKVLLENDSKALWNKISWRRTYRNTDRSNKAKLEELKEHLEKDESASGKSTLLSDIICDRYVEVLNREITLEEIEDSTAS